MDRLPQINKVISTYFIQHPQEHKIRAKELMPEFVKAGIFDKDVKKGLPIRRLLRELDEKGELRKVPSAYAERKEKNTWWYFMRTNL